eukprot:TRINITY_DN42794_c0_g2_i1.p1 TRINITY_DN42794_c0_g2~~TRINITY_DN42794_c0_g2_i1.p1  ORF type:complete len:2503 (+),score=628.99 TRINITY_DN42794_c0_g2_i1:85-7593(+)
MPGVLGQNDYLDAFSVTLEAGTSADDWKPKLVDRAHGLVQRLGDLAALGEPAGPTSPEVNVEIEVVRPKPQAWKRGSHRPSALHSRFASPKNQGSPGRSAAAKLQLRKVLADTRAGLTGLGKAAESWMERQATVDDMRDQQAGRDDDRHTSNLEERLEVLRGPEGDDSAARHINLLLASPLLSAAGTRGYVALPATAMETGGADAVVVHDPLEASAGPATPRGDQENDGARTYTEEQLHNHIEAAVQRMEKKALDQAQKKVDEEYRSKVLRLESRCELLEVMERDLRKTSEINSSKVTKIQEKMHFVRTGFKPLQDMLHRQELVDVRELRKEIAFYRQEREYLYSKVFGCEIDRQAEAELQAAAGAAIPRMRKGGTSEANAGPVDDERRSLKQRIAKLTEELARTRLYCIKLVRASRLHELDRMEAHDRDATLAQSSPAPRRARRPRAAGTGAGAKRAGRGSPHGAAAADAGTRSPMSDEDPLDDQDDAAGDGTWDRPAETDDKAVESFMEQLKLPPTTMLHKLFRKLLERIMRSVTTYNKLIDQVGDAVRGHIVEDPTARGAAMEAFRTHHNLGMDERKKFMTQARHMLKEIRGQLKGNPVTSEAMTDMQIPCFLPGDPRADEQQPEPDSRCPLCNSLADHAFETDSEAGVDEKELAPADRAARKELRTGPDGLKLPEGVRKKRSRRYWEAWGEDRVREAREEEMKRREEELKAQQALLDEAENAWKNVPQKVVGRTAQQPPGKGRKGKGTAAAGGGGGAAAGGGAAGGRQPGGGDDEDASDESGHDEDDAGGGGGKGKSQELRKERAKASKLEAFIRTKNQLMESRAIAMHHTVFGVIRRLQEDLQIPAIVVPKEKPRNKAEIRTEMQKFQHIVDVLTEDEAALRVYHELMKKANQNALGKLRGNLKDLATEEQQQRTAAIEAAKKAGDIPAHLRDNPELPDDQRLALALEREKLATERREAMALQLDQLIDAQKAALEQAAANAAAAAAANAAAGAPATAPAAAQGPRGPASPTDAPVAPAGRARPAAAATPFNRPGPSAALPSSAAAGPPAASAAPPATEQAQKQPAAAPASPSQVPERRGLAGLTVAVTSAPMASPSGSPSPMAGSRPDSPMGEAGGDAGAAQRLGRGGATAYGGGAAGVAGLRKYKPSQMQPGPQGRAKQLRKQQFTAFCRDLGEHFREFLGFFIHYSSDAIGVAAVERLVQTERRRQLGGAKEHQEVHPWKPAGGTSAATKCPACKRAPTSSPFCPATGKAHYERRRDRADGTEEAEGGAGRPLPVYSPRSMRLHRLATGASSSPERDRGGQTARNSRASSSDEAVAGPEAGDDKTGAAKDAETAAATGTEAASPDAKAPEGAAGSAEKKLPGPPAATTPPAAQTRAERRRQRLLRQAELAKPPRALVPVGPPPPSAPDVRAWRALADPLRAEREELHRRVIQPVAGVEQQVRRMIQGGSSFGGPEAEMLALSAERCAVALQRLANTCEKEALHFSRLRGVMAGMVIAEPDLPARPLLVAEGDEALQLRIANLAAAISDAAGTPTTPTAQALAWQGRQPSPVMQTGALRVAGDHTGTPGVLHIAAQPSSPPALQAKHSAAWGDRPLPASAADAGQPTTPGDRVLPPALGGHAGQADWNQQRHAPRAPAGAASASSNAPGGSTDSAACSGTPGGSEERITAQHSTPSAEQQQQQQQPAPAPDPHYGPAVQHPPAQSAPPPPSQGEPAGWQSAPPPVQLQQPQQQHYQQQSPQHYQQQSPQHYQQQSPQHYQQQQPLQPQQQPQQRQLPPSQPLAGPAPASPPPPPRLPAQLGGVRPRQSPPPAPQAPARDAHRGEGAPPQQSMPQALRPRHHGAPPQEEPPPQPPPQPVPAQHPILPPGPPVPLGPAAGAAHPELQPYAHGPPAAQQQSPQSRLISQPYAQRSPPVASPPQPGPLRPRQAAAALAVLGAAAVLRHVAALARLTQRVRPAGPPPGRSRPPAAPSAGARSAPGEAAHHSGGAGAPRTAAPTRTVAPGGSFDPGTDLTQTSTSGSTLVRVERSVPKQSPPPPAAAGTPPGQRRRSRTEPSLQTSAMGGAAEGASPRRRHSAFDGGVTVAVPDAALAAGRGPARGRSDSIRHSPSPPSSPVLGASRSQPTAFGLSIGGSGVGPRAASAQPAAKHAAAQAHYRGEAPAPLQLQRPRAATAAQRSRSPPSSPRQAPLPSRDQELPVVAPSFSRPPTSQATRVRAASHPPGAEMSKPLPREQAPGVQSVISVVRQAAAAAAEPPAGPVGVSTAPSAPLEPQQTSAEAAARRQRLMGKLRSAVRRSRSPPHVAHTLSASGAGSPASPHSDESPRGPSSGARDHPTTQQRRPASQPQPLELCIGSPTGSDSSRGRRRAHTALRSQQRSAGERPAPAGLPPVNLSRPGTAARDFSPRTTRYARPWLDMGSRSPCPSSPGSRPGSGPATPTESPRVADVVPDALQKLRELPVARQTEQLIVSDPDSLRRPPKSQVQAAFEKLGIRTV